MTGVDVFLMLLVVFAVAAALRQHRIDRHDCERKHSRDTVKRILDAIGDRR